MVQRWVARFALGRYNNTSSAWDMLSELGWTALQTRKQKLTLQRTKGAAMWVCKTKDVFKVLLLKIYLY